jgi:hypothetical protein
MGMTISEDVDTPKIGDKVRVADRDLEIRAVIVEEETLILAEAEPVRRKPSVWVLSVSKLVRLSADLWQATDYRFLKRPDEPPTRRWWAREE